MMLILWFAITVFPDLFIKIFSHNQEIIKDGIRALRLYFFGFFMMAFQMVGQAAAIGLGKAKQAIFFSVFRKVIIVAPLTIILPVYIGVDGIFKISFDDYQFSELICSVSLIFIKRNCISDVLINKVFIVLLLFYLC